MLGSALCPGVASATVHHPLDGAPAVTNGVRLRHACQSATPAAAACNALITVDGRGAAAPSTSPSGWGADALEAAYRGNVARGGGFTIGIVDAYDDANAEAELGVYRAAVWAFTVYGRERLLHEAERSG